MKADEIVEQGWYMITEPDTTVVRNVNDAGSVLSEILSDEFNFYKSGSRLRKDVLKVDIGPLVAAMRENGLDIEIERLGLTAINADDETSIIDFFNHQLATGSQKLISITNLHLMAEVVAYGYVGINPDDPIAFMTAKEMAETVTAEWGNATEKGVIQLYRRMMKDGRVPTVELSGSGRNVITRSQFEAFTRELQQSNRAVSEGWPITDDVVRILRERLGGKNIEHADFLRAVQAAGVQRVTAYFTEGNQIMYNPDDIDSILEELI
jgi:hypothetical protein